MPSKVQLYAQMADRTAEQITGSYQKWTAFLTTAARLYKYPYNEQLMIYICLLYTSPSPRDIGLSRMPSSA